MLQTNVLLTLHEDEPCKRFQEFGEEPDVRVKTSDNKHFSARLALGPLSLHSEEGGGEKWTKIEFAGIQAKVGEPGLPAIPVWHALVAVPRGASVHVKTAPPIIREKMIVNLYPYQEQFADLADEKYQTPLFVKDEKFYEMDEFYPVEPCSIELVGNVRGLNIAQLSCTTGQYNPVKKIFKQYKAVDFEVIFEGGDGDFISDRNLSPFEPTVEQSVAHVLNSAVVGKYVYPEDLTGLVVYGEELLILTHPDFLDAANDLATWKEEKGIITSVFAVGEGTSYVTGEEIDKFIEDRYENCVVRLSYVLLLGDSEFIPPARTDHDTDASCGSCGDVTNGSDYLYSVYPEFFLDIFPDFGVGRIPVDTLAEAQLVVDKIINYESDPPFVNWFAGEPFYTTAANTAEFQGYLMDADGSPRDGQDGRAQRSFTEVSEFVRSHMMASGYDVERIYEATEDSGGYCLNDPCTIIQQPYTGVDTPNRYRNGSLLPADIRASSGFAWDGDTNAIVDAFNDGRFLILHRDHGATNGWGTPSFRTWDFGGLTNGELLPVVYSVNCASGFWDRETDSGSTTESFMELLLMEEDGGMVGGLGDNRNSPTWANSALTRGFYDATWPNVAPEFGGSSSITRLGDILNHGKMYLISQIGVDQTAGSVSISAAVGELIMWHAYGDPTLEMWTGNPYRMILSVEHWAQLSEELIKVGYAVDGAVITAFQPTQDGTVPVGRGVVKDQMAVIPIFHPPVKGVPIMLSASYQNAVSVLLTQQIPSTLPDLIVEELAPAPFAVAAGESIKDYVKIVVGNLGQKDAPGTINPDGTTKDGYMVDLVLSTDEVVPEGWAVPSSIFVEDALLVGGRISRTPDVLAGASVTLSNAPPINSDIGGIIPKNTKAGNYFLCARIDPGDAVDESTEDNNLTCLQIKVTNP